MLSKFRKVLSRVVNGAASPGDSLKSALVELQSLNEINVVLDIGANIGQSARRFLNLFPNASIYCAEPDPIAFSNLERIAERNRRVHAFHLALSDKSIDLDLNINSAAFTNSFLPVASSAASFIDPSLLVRVGSHKIRTSTLPEFCSRIGVNRIDFLKLDVQGFEDRILEGCGGWLTPERIGMVYSELLFINIYDDQAQFDVVSRILREKGYKLHSFHEMASKKPIGLMWGDALFVQREPSIK